MTISIGKQFNRIESIKHSYILFLLIISQALVFIPVGMYRLVDGDEGYYILASKLVLEGKTLYSDFLYTQVPLLPYFYGAWMSIFGVSWVSARFLSVLLTMVIGILLYFCIFSSRKSKKIALLGVLFYLTSSYTFGWFTVVKTYALSSFLLLSSYTTLRHMPKCRPTIKYIFSGFLLGLSINTRLFFCAVIPAFMIGIYNDKKREPFSSKAIVWVCFISGILIALLPNIYFICTNYENYYFGNIGYHALRSDSGLIGGVGQKLRTLRCLIGIGSARGVISLQFTLLLLLNLCYFINISLKKQQVDLAFYIWLSLFVVSFLPTPTFVQYFSVITPFIILTAMLWEGDEYTSSQYFIRNQIVKSVRSMMYLLFLLYVFISPIDMLRYTVFGYQVPGVRGLWDRVNWKIPIIRVVSGEIDKRNYQKKLVMSTWPGYLVEAESQVISGMENHFSLSIAGKLSTFQKRQYHIVSSEDIIDSINNSNVVVLGNWTVNAIDSGILSQHGYKLVSTIGNTEILTRD